MDRPIKLWEMIIAFFGIIVTCGTMVYNVGTRDAGNAIEINNLKVKIGDLRDDLMKSKTEVSKQSEAINQKLDKLSENVVDLKVILQNKQDRK